MSRSPIVTISKSCSFLLRHRPEAAGLTLDAQGWVEVDALLAGLGRIGRRADRALLERVVEQNDKRRFEFSDDGLRIRARQGHSVPVELGLPSRAPPGQLWHGTVARFLPSILDQGLQPRGRHHVHLSAERDTARTVGARRGRPVLLVVEAAQMAAEGHTFFCTDNGVWLTAHVPPRFLRRESPESAL
jgi:putative RNA 2'-phosphotransferase